MTKKIFVRNILSFPHNRRLPTFAVDKRRLCGKDKKDLINMHILHFYLHNFVRFHMLFDNPFYHKNSDKTF